MTTRRWTNHGLPQTLQGAVLFCYLNAALAVIYALIGIAQWLAVFVLLAIGAYGIANEKKWAYFGSVVVAVFYCFATLAALVTGSSLGTVLNLLFAGLLVALLLHPESRHYARIWFR